MRFWKLHQNARYFVLFSKPTAARNFLLFLIWANHKRSQPRPSLILKSKPNDNHFILPTFEFVQSFLCACHSLSKSLIAEGLVRTQTLRCRQMIKLSNIDWHTPNSNALSSANGYQNVKTIHLQASYINNIMISADTKKKIKNSFSDFYCHPVFTSASAFELVILIKCLLS